MRPCEHRHQGSVNFTRYWPAGLVYKPQFLPASSDRNWHRYRDLAGVQQLQGQHLGIHAESHGKERSSVKAERDPLIVQLCFDGQAFEYAARIVGRGSGEPLCQLRTTLPDQLSRIT
jgi:hypothetical protein